MYKRQHAPAGDVNWVATYTASGGSATPISCLTHTGPLAGIGSNQSVYTCTVTATAAGSFSATASFLGDTNYAPVGPSNVASVTVGKSSPTGSIVLTGSGGSGVLGSNLVFSAAVTGLGGIAPTGTVNWTVIAVSYTHLTLPTIYSV